MSDIKDFIDKAMQEAERQSYRIRDHRVFDFNYLPEKPLMRTEAARIVDSIARYHQTGIPRNIVVIGSRGSGKTLILKYLAKVFAEEFHLPFHYVNCRLHNSSFKIIARLLGVKARGFAYSELCERFEAEIPAPAVVVLDEVDLMSEADSKKEILYFLSRTDKRYAVILLSNNPRFLKDLDESTRSSLQTELLHFKNYSPDEIRAILADRAAAGLKTTDSALLAEIAAMTAKNTNSDIRVALKTLLYCARNEAESVAACFERARQDIVVDMVSDLNDKALLILRAALEEPTGFVKAMYQKYVNLSKAVGETPYSYVHFYNNLPYLQSVGLIMIVSAKVDRAYTNRIEPLVSADVIKPVFDLRFQ